MYNKFYLTFIFIRLYLCWTAEDISIPRTKLQAFTPEALISTKSAPTMAIDCCLTDWIFLFNHSHSTEWKKILWLQVLFPVLTQNQNVFFIITKLTAGEKALLSREMYWLNVKVRLEPSQFCQCSSFQHKNFWYLILVSICC